MSYHLSLNGEDWIFKEFYGLDWVLRKSHLPNSRDQNRWWSGSVPGSVVNDLWTQGLIEDPFFECNTYGLEWVSQRTWLYKKTFKIPSEFKGKRVQLCFEGVDYESKYFLNGFFLGSHRGMFTPAVFEVEEYLNINDENLITVVIESAPKEQPQVGRTSLVHTHKCRMTYWWDFCPRLIHQGIWDNVYLTTSGQVRVEDIYIRSEIAPDLRSAKLAVKFVLDASFPAELTANMKISLSGKVVSEGVLPLAVSKGQQSFTHNILIDNVSLWYPNGIGESAVYMIEVVLHDGAEILHSKKEDFGIRKIEMIPNEGASKKALPYTLVVNDRKIYMKGWNWVPVDILYGEQQKRKVIHLLRLAKLAHVNVLRIWGGGLIENEEFYELCDRFGIFVWQEFILSSSGIDNKPSTHDAYVEMLTGEAEVIVRKKRNHPSLLFWCGGNELQTDDGIPLDDSYPTIAALKSVVSRLDPESGWLPTSPSGGVFGNTLENIKTKKNDMHDVHGPWEYQGAINHYELYNHGESLLHSEFGVEGITNKSTLDKVIHTKHQWPISITKNKCWHHLGAWWVKRDAWDRTFGKLSDVDSYIKATQFTQFDGLRYAVEADRRRKYHNSGTFPWQFNEPYPMAACTSAVDYFGNPKPAYYAVKNAYEPIHVSAKHAGLLWGNQKEFKAEIWANNSHQEEIVDLLLEVRLVSSVGQVFNRQNLCCSLPGNNSVHLQSYKTSLKDVPQTFFLDLILREKTGRKYSASRYVYTKAENLASLLQQPRTKLISDCQMRDNNWLITLHNNGAHTAMYVWAEDYQPPGGEGYAYFSENYFCLLPDEIKTINVTWENYPQHNRKIKIKAWNSSEIVIESDFK